MNDNFLKNLKQTLGEEFNESVTENGALGYRTSGKELLDLNFAVSSLRNATVEDIKRRFAKAYYENPILAVKWLFYAGDVRGGLGERRLFRACIEWLAEEQPDTAKKVLALLPEYTRWDSYLAILHSSLQDEVCKTLKAQLDSDMKGRLENKPISLCAKWMPSVNASCDKTVNNAKFLIKQFGITQREYRKMLSALRKYLDVVEVKMSAKEWGGINYEAVPSRANLIYNTAFLRNDEERRRAYLSSLEKGETKINAGVLFPHDIVHRYMEPGRSCSLKGYDTALEQMWKALPNYVKGNGNTICVADGSGSMRTTIGGTSVSALSVANALAIYFSERSSGQFKNKYITFSEHPQLVDFSGCTTLRDKIATAFLHNEVANTNIEAVFNLILQTAINAKMKQSDMPTNILILSDMEFDNCVTAGKPRPSSSWWNNYGTRPDEKLFTTIANRYAEHGYKLPRLVFWNIMSRTGTIPIKENELGVALVSGFSPAVVNMVLSNCVDPYECLLEQLNSERYAPVEAAIKA